MNQMDVQSLIDAHEHIVLFDGVCNLCTGWVRFLVSRDSQARLSFCSVQSSQGQAIWGLLENTVPSVGSTVDTMIYIRKGKVFVRSEAFFQIVKLFPMPWCWLKVFGLVPLSVRDWLYRKVAHHRYRFFGRSSHCLVPTQKERARFIDA